jgi:hypothetical protein
LDRQMEWADKIRDAQLKVMAMEARSGEYKRCLEKIEDPAKHKRLKTENSVLRTSLAKMETENDWLKRTYASSQTNVDKLTRTQDELWGKFYDLQREKEKEILHLTLNHYKSHPHPHPK